MMKSWQKSFGAPMRTDWSGCLILMHISWLVLFLKLEKDVGGVYLSNIVCALCHDCCVWSFFTMKVFMLIFGTLVWFCFCLFLVSWQFCMTRSINQWKIALATGWRREALVQCFLNKGVLGSMGVLTACTLGAQQNKGSNIFILIPSIAHTVTKCHRLG